ncbi:MAG: type II toxin-antitoxin system death-on-curing family toxin [Myxococcota bacterium]
MTRGRKRGTRPVWLQPRLVLAVHDLLIVEHGGLPGLRDEGLLESALARPLNLYAYSKPDLPALAACYAAAIIANHPFIDGNKRTGFAAAATFLDRNGAELGASEADATRMTVALAAGNTTEDAYAAWLRDNAGRR